MYEYMMERAFAGMKADSGCDRVESFAAGLEIEFGIAVSLMSKGSDQIVSGGSQSSPVIGISVHSHTVTGGMYQKGDSVSVMTKGLVWMQVDSGDSTTTSGSAVKVNTDGRIDSTGGHTVKRSVVRDVITTDAGKIALVELDSPMI